MSVNHFLFPSVCKSLLCLSDLWKRTAHLPDGVTYFHFQYENFYFVGVPFQNMRKWNRHKIPRIWWEEFPFCATRDCDTSAEKWQKIWIFTASRFLFYAAIVTIRRCERVGSSHSSTAMNWPRHHKRIHTMQQLDHPTVRWIAIEFSRCVSICTNDASPRFSVAPRRRFFFLTDGYMTTLCQLEIASIYTFITSHRKITRPYTADKQPIWYKYWC